MSFTYKFKKPFEYDGETYEEISFDLESLTGKDLIKVEAEMQMLGYGNVIPEADQRYQAKLAARAAGLGSDIIEALPIDAFRTVVGKIRGLHVKRPVRVKEFTFDFDSLTGKDLIEIEMELRRKGNTSQPEFSQSYQAILAARAAGVGVGVIEGLPADVFNAIARKARDFLLIGSAGTAQETVSEDVSAS